MAQYTKQLHKIQNSNATLSNCASLLQQLCQFSIDAMVIYDASGRIQGMNKKAEYVFGYAACDIFNQPISHILPIFKDVAKDSGYLTYMTSGLNAKGHAFPVEMMLTEFSGIDRPYYLAIIRDMTATETSVDSELSPRQRQVLKLVVQGYTSREIAEMLTISIKTVETHRANIMNKLGVHNVSSLVRLAIEQNII